MDHAKIARLQALASKNGRNKGQPRRAVGYNNQTQQHDYERYLEKAEPMSISSSDELNLFTQDGRVVHFENVEIRANMVNDKPVYYCTVQSTKRLDEAEDLETYLPQILDHLDKAQVETMEKKMDCIDDI